MHGVAGRRFAALGSRFFEAMNSIFLDLAGGNFREAQGAEERHQVHARPPVLAVDVDLAALALRDEVVLAQELFRGFAEGLFCFDFAAAEHAAKLQIPVLGDLFGSREAIFLRGCPAVFPAEVGGTLPAGAVRAFVNVNLAAQDKSSSLLRRSAAFLPSSLSRR